jgi:hypothetical protein
MTKVMGVGMLLVAPGAFLGVFSIPIYLGATFLFVLWLKSHTKSEKSTSLQTALPIAVPPTRPPSASPTERGKELHYEEAYERTAEELRQLLSDVTNQESAQSFVEQAARHVKEVAVATPEFYLGEFYGRFREAIRAEVNAEIATCERESSEITSANEAVVGVLNARLREARAGGGQDAEHAIWGEAEQRRTESQAAIDALAQRLVSCRWRFRAVLDIGPVLGLPHSTNEGPESDRTANDESRPRSGGDSGMGPIETAVRSGITAGAVLSTPTGRGQFIVAEVGARGPILLLGRQQTRTLIPWPAVEGVRGFLGAEGWTVIGGVFDQAADPTTLDGYMKRFVNRATAGWVACLLERAGVVQIDRRPPARVHMRPDFSPSTDPRNETGS